MFITKLWVWMGKSCIASVDAKEPLQNEEKAALRTIIQRFHTTDNLPDVKVVKEQAEVFSKELAEKIETIEYQF